MKKINLQKEAVVLLISAFLVFSTIAVTANTNDALPKDAVSLRTSGSYETEYKVNNQGTTGGQILWDNGLPDGRDGISCCYVTGMGLDRENIDDFHNEEEWTITDGHFRYVTYSGLGPGAILGVNVFIYLSTGPCEPSTTRHAERYDVPFTAALTGDSYFGRPEIAIDCNFDPIVCPPGEWWICFQPVLDENGFWLTAPDNECPIWTSMPDIPYPKWTSSMTAFGEDYDLAWYITGGAAPELEIGEIKGGFGVSSSIKNVGDANATNVDWSIKLDGGFILLGGETTGTIASIAPNDEEAIKSGLIFGIGKTTITVAAECDEGASDEGNATGFVFLFFVIGVS